MAGRAVYFNVKLTPGILRWAALGFLLLASAVEPGTESLTLSTTYPAPSGVYAKMITTGDTFLARDAGGRVGVGNTHPLATLDIAGSFRMADGSQAAGKVLTSDDNGLAQWSTGLSTGPALYQVTNAYCSGSGQITTQGTCSTSGSGAHDTYRGCTCYYSCNGALYFTNGAGDIGCYNCGGPANCDNTLMGYLIRP